jgi:uncharacterized surface protein with fasciclin (FAS1) repeats
MIETLLGKDVLVEIDGDTVQINNATVLVTDIDTKNGIIHIIDAVLLPPALPDIVQTAKDAGIFTTLVAALEATGLDQALAEPGPFTVFAPTDEAFAALGIPPADLLANPDLSNILAYHVTEGRLNAAEVVANDRITTLLGEDVRVSVVDGEVFINDSKVIVADFKAENGIIHVIDAVLFPPDTPDIVDTAIAAGSFNTLVDLLVATGLDEVLRGNGPFTVFAPTDEAFAKLPSWLLRGLLDNPDLLKSVLLYHVVGDDLDASEVLSQRRIQSVQGTNLYPWAWKDRAYINRSKILQTDITTRNGTIHVIDRVLIPWWY